MAKIKRKIKTTQKNLESPFKNYWTKNNYILLGIGIVFIILGYFLMTKGPWDNPTSLTIAPFVLLIAYVIIFPLSILYKKKEKSKAKN